MICFKQNRPSLLGSQSDNANRSSASSNTLSKSAQIIDVSLYLDLAFIQVHTNFSEAYILRANVTIKASKMELLERLY